MKGKELTREGRMNKRKDERATYGRQEGKQVKRN